VGFEIGQKRQVVDEKRSSWKRGGKPWKNRAGKRWGVGKRKNHIVSNPETCLCNRNIRGKQLNFQGEKERTSERRILAGAKSGTRGAKAKRGGVKKYTEGGTRLTESRSRRARSGSDPRD